MLSASFRIGLVIAAGAATIPALLAAFDRSAAYANTEPLVRHERPSVEGARRRAAALLAASRYPAAAKIARSVLERQPLDRTALRILTAAEGAMGREDLAGDLAIAASFVSWRDPAAELQMFSLDAGTGRLDDAARRADAISRLNGHRATGFGALNLLLSQTGGARAVAARLATRPPWREDYFRDVRHGLGAAPQRALPLLRALARTGSPASAGEVDQALAVMVARGFAPEAWTYWRQTLGGAAGPLIDDPDFRIVQIGEPGRVNSPFAWSTPPDTLVRVTEADRASDAPALRVEMRGDRSVMFVSRHLVVAPGRYRLTYHAEGAPDQVDRLHPDLRCSDSTAIRLQPAGRDFASSIAEVPADCPVLRLGFTLEPGDSPASTELSIRQVTFTKL